jgi:hypothetical protein
MSPGTSAQKEAYLILEGKEIVVLVITASNAIRKASGGWLAAGVLATALLQSACLASSSSATFERTLKVDGPVRLEVSTGSGKILIRSSSAGSVRIHGEVRAGGLFGASGSRRALEIASNPPIDQSGNIVRLGGRRGESLFGSASISYTIETPADTQVTAKSGSGDVDIAGLVEPVSVTLGSGTARVDDVKDNVTITLGSGAIRVTRVQGSVSFSTGSGSVKFSQVREEIRGSAGSGPVEVEQAQGRVSVRTGSGPIRVNGASQDVRASTGSGTIEVRGNPAAEAFWDLGTGSGGIQLAVPGSASFALTARTSSGNVSVDMPIRIEEQSRRFLRARVGDGQAHVNLETRSGNIRILRGGTS